MKGKFALLAVSLQKVNRQHIQLALTVISLVMLVIGVGAPTDGDGPK